MKRFMAVDLGASGGKSFLGTFNEDSFAFQELHRFSHEGVTFFIPDAAGEVTRRMYWDDIFIYRNIVTGLYKFKREIGANLDSIGIDTWGADGQFIAENGDLLGKVYCYRDHRLDTMVEVIKGKMDPRRIYDITGIHFQPFNLSNQLYWFKENRESFFSLAACFLPIPTLFYYWLGGITSVDSSWASVTQLMDAREKKWSSEIMDALGLPENIMPRIVDPGTVMGEIHPELARKIGLKGVQLTAVGSHDTASAFAAAPVNDYAESLIISSGTWSLVGKLVPEPVTTDEAYRYNLSNEGGIGNIRLLRNCMGTWLVQELRRVWRVQDGKEMEWGELVSLAEKAPPFTAFIDPDDSSFYNPENMEEAIVSFCKRTKQKVPENRGGILRVVYESLALKYRWVNELICKASGTETKVINVVGGGSRNTMLNQFTADALGLPVVSGPDEATAVGNIMAQAFALGVIPSLKEAMPYVKSAFSIEEFKPQTAGGWREQYERFLTICS